MYLEKLSLLNFKNIEQTEIIFSEKLNCFTGHNGAGKTNLLDSIYYLSFCKSYFNFNDAANILHDSDYFMIKGTFNRFDKPEEISCSLKKNKKKVFKRNNKEYKKLSEHIGLLPVVIVSPDDSKLVNGSSEERRKFVDLVISQYDYKYLIALIEYNRILLQRNKLLKLHSENKKFDKETLSIYNQQLSVSGGKIYLQRKKFVENLIPIFNKYHQYISGNAETVSIEYRSQLETGNFQEKLDSTVEKDLALGFTSTGIHRDDLTFKISEYPLSKTASQGQQKTFLIALKFAEYNFIEKVSKIKPILLLDDIFDKFDKTRVSKIIEMAIGKNFGQIFITDTGKERLLSILSASCSEYKLFEMENGKIIE